MTWLVVPAVLVVAVVLRWPLQAVAVKSEEQLISEWDGCEALPSSVAKRPNVPGLGPVSQVGPQSWRAGRGRDAD